MSVTRRPAARGVAWGSVTPGTASSAADGGASEGCEAEGALMANLEAGAGASSAASKAVRSPR